MAPSLSSHDALEIARTAALDQRYLEQVETLVMGSPPGSPIPDYAEDWDEAERLIARLGDQGVGVRLEFLSDENGQRWHVYMDWQETISHEWQLTEVEEATAARAITRGALVWYFQQELAAASAQPPDGWAYFEVVERLGMARDMLARSLDDHPVLAEEEALMTRYQELLEKFTALFELANQMLDQRLGAPSRSTMH
ncbi:hypothetical protein ACJU26_11095 [Acidithiobacillus sp. M4-SHS-6]|uniref:hypothetical protein n=1 Tax=Acidithiobacillus sp. M4-SHS-6 TaxID=3383024 RepID=UPI0039BE0C40